VNNSYLGLIRQAQRGFAMDCKAIRVTDPNDARAAFATAREWIARYSVLVVVEFILERVTNIAMGTEIDNIIEFEEVLDLLLDETPTGRELLLPV
jgi:tartronate-semialdehyde synthase